MSPISEADRHDPPWLIGEFVPGEAAMIDNIAVGFEDYVREAVVRHELPDVLDRNEFQRSRRQGQQGDVVGNDQASLRSAIRPDRRSRWHGHRARQWPLFPANAGSCPGPSALSP